MITLVTEHAVTKTEATNAVWLLVCKRVNATGVRRPCVLPCCGFFLSLGGNLRIAVVAAWIEHPLHFTGAAKSKILTQHHGLNRFD